MLRRLGGLLSLWLCLYLAGGHWAVLQTVAWSGMILNYSRVHGLQKGVEETFDGKHPCPMCKKVTEGVHNESAQPDKQQQQASKTDKKPATCTAQTAPSTPRGIPTRPVLPRDLIGFSARSETPPVPPPKRIS